MVLNSTAVQLSWQYPGSPNGEIRGYSILYSSIPDNEMIILSITLDTIDDISNQTTVVSRLTPFTLYGFHVRAFSFGDQNERPNFVHIGISTDEIRVRTDEDGKIYSYTFIRVITTCLHAVPGAPTNFVVQAITSTMVRVSWNVPNVTNGILLNYTLIFSNGIETSVIRYNNNTFEATINNLNKYTEYRFIIFANTSAGAGDNATDTERTLEDG